MAEIECVFDEDFDEDFDDEDFYEDFDGDFDDENEDGENEDGDLPASGTVPDATPDTIFDQLKDGSLISEYSVDGLGAYGYGSMYVFCNEEGFWKQGFTGCMSSFDKAAGVQEPVAIMNWVKSVVPIHPVWWAYLTDPVHSPWVRHLEPGSIATYSSPDGLVKSFMVKDLMHTAQFLQSFWKASRIYTERHEYGLVNNWLLDAGVHPGIAMFVSQQVRRAGEGVGAGVTLTQQSSWHGGFMENNESFESLKRFINGEFRWNKGDYPASIGGPGSNYRGVDSIVSYDTHIGGISGYLKDSYPQFFEEKKMTTGRFGGYAMSGGLTLGSITLACLQLQQDLKLEKYG